MAYNNSHKLLNLKNARLCKTQVIGMMTTNKGNFNRINGSTLVYSIPQYLNVREEVKLQAYNRFMGLSHPIKQVGAFIFIPFNVHKIFIIKQMLKRFYIIQ